MIPLDPLTRHAPTVAAQDRSAQLYLQPQSGRFVAGLANPVIGWVHRDGLPWATRVRCAALALDTVSDAHGFFAFVTTPPLHAEPWHFTLGEGDAPLWLDLTPQITVAQLQMLAPIGAFAQAQPEPLHFDTLPFHDPIWVDLWLDDVLVGVTGVRPTQQHFDTHLSLRIAGVDGFLTLVAFRNLLTPQGTQTAAVRPLGAANQAPLAALLARSPNDPWLRRVTRGPNPPSERLTAFALARARIDHQGTPLLYDGTARTQEAFATRRATLHRTIYRTMGSLMGLSCVAIVLTLWQMRRRLRARFFRTLQDGINADEAADVEAARSMTRMTHAAYLVLAVAALVAACYGLLAVVSRMQWR